MIKNAKSLKDKARNIANENAISIQQVLQNYMFERWVAIIFNNGDKFENYYGY